MSWLPAILLACPIVAAKMKTQYVEGAYVCALDYASDTKMFTVCLLTLVSFKIQVKENFYLE